MRDSPSAVARRPRKVIVRRMLHRDVAAVAALERVCFDRPWSEQSFLTEVSRRASIAVVATERREVAGYGVAWLVSDEVHVVNLAVRPSFRGSGIGRTLLQALLAKGRQHGAAVATLEVRARNAAARRLYESLGFQTVAIHTRYYHEPDDDALVMLRTAGMDILGRGVTC